MTSADRDAVASVSCPRCQGQLTPVTVRTVLWRSDHPAIVEDVPAHVCSSCMEQFYDDSVSEALRKIAEGTFDLATADRVVAVPVYSLTSRLRAGVPLPDDCYVD